MSIGRPSDLAIGAFSDQAPWIVDPDTMPWRVGIDALRARVRVEAPVLTRRRRLPPAGRTLRVLTLLTEALGVWYVGDRRTGGAPSRAGLSRRLRKAFEVLGPTYIKLGQILSSGEGLFPDELVAEFKLLRDQVPPESFDAVRRTVEEDFGKPLDAVFSRFDPVPVAAASIAQVHAAQLTSGEQVVVKVQRPTVTETVRRDLAVMSTVAPLLVGHIPVSTLANPPALVDLFAETIVEELDFRLEAQNMLDVARVLAAGDQRSIVVPRPHPILVTRRVLVMERLDGFLWGDVEAMQAAGVDTASVLHAAIIAFLEGGLLYGVFHGDLHGGNLFVRPDGTVALLDYGITGRLDENERLALLRLIIAGASNDVHGSVAAMRDLGALPPDTDVDAVITDLGLDREPFDPTQLSGEQLTAELRHTTKALLGYGARMPKELMLYVKDMLFIDGALKVMAPDIDIINEIVTIVMHFTQHHGARIAADMGIDQAAIPDVDVDAVRASFGIVEPGAGLTHRELLERREVIRHRLEDYSRQQRRR